MAPRLNLLLFLGRPPRVPPLRRRVDCGAGGSRQPGGGNDGTARSGRWGNQNRLSENKAVHPDVESSSLHSLEEGSRPAQPMPEWHRDLAREAGRLQYLYFNWRQDTWSDLQLFMVLNTLVFLAGAWVEVSAPRGCCSLLFSAETGASFCVVC